MTTHAERMAIRRGTVVIVNLGAVGPPGADREEAVGHEQMKTRPAVVVSSDVQNRVIGKLIVLPISSVKAPGRVRPHEVLIKAGEGGMYVDSVAQATQIRTIDRHERVHKVIGQLEGATMAQIGLAMLHALGGM